MCLGSPGSLRSLSISHMGAHTRHLTVSFFAQPAQYGQRRQKLTSRPDVPRASASGPSGPNHIPATPYDHLSAPIRPQAAGGRSCPPWTRCAAPPAVPRRAAMGGGDGSAALGRPKSPPPSLRSLISEPKSTAALRLSLARGEVGRPPGERSASHAGLAVRPRCYQEGVTALCVPASHSPLP